MPKDKKPTKKQSSKPKQKGKGGRKPYYDILHIREKLDAIRGWAKQGSTDADIMKMLGVSHETFYKWKKEKLEFADALKKGKEISNGELLNSAFKQSTGFYVPVDLVVKLKKPVIMGGDVILVDGEPVIVDGKPLMTGGKVYYEEVAEIVPSQEFVAPNSTMGIFMIKNRMPEDYKDKREITHKLGSKLEDFFGEGEQEDA